MRENNLAKTASRSGFRYYDGAEFVKCRHCGVQYRISDGRAAELMISHYPYCRGRFSGEWRPRFGSDK